MNATVVLNRSLALGLLGTLTLGLGACRTTNDNVPYGANQDPIGQQAYPGIAVEQPLQQFVAVDYDAIIVDAADGTTPMHVQVPIRSTAYEQMSVQYLFSWYDVDGRTLSDSGWRFISLDAGLQDMIEGQARTQDAERFRLEIRSAR